MEQKLRIQEIQDAQKLSNRELAALCGVTEVNVSYWRSGTRTPPLSTLLKIADVLKVNVLELYVAPDGFYHHYDPKTGAWLGIQKK